MKKVFSLIIALCFFVVLMPNSVFGQSEEEEFERILFTEIPTVESVSFFDTKKDLAPGSVFVISKYQMENSTVKDLHEIMNVYVPGFDVSHHEFLQSVTGVRGILTDNSAKTIVMHDGLVLNNRYHCGYQFSMECPLLGDLDRIEVISGPGALVHGTGAINGFVNLIPKTGATSEGFFVNTRIGPIESLTQLEVGKGLKYDNGDLFIYTGMAQAGGHALNIGSMYNYQEDIIDAGYTDNFNAYKAGRIPLAFRASSVWNHNDFGLNFFYQRFYKGTTSPHRNWMNGQALLGVNPKYTMVISDTDSIELTASYLIIDSGAFDPNLKDGGAIATQTDTVNVGEASQMDIVETIIAGKGIYRTTKIANHSIAAGIAFSKRKMVNWKPILFKLDGDMTSSEWDWGWLETGIFAEDVINVGENLVCSIGVRQDMVKYDSTLLVEGYQELTGNSISHLSPRLALAYRLNKESVAKLSYQHGFRYPDGHYQRINYLGNKAGWLKPNVLPLLDPETMDSIEASYSTMLLYNQLGLDINAYYNTLTNTLGWIWGFDNAEEPFSSVGAEVTTKWQINETTKWNFTYGISLPMGYSEDLYNSRSANIVPVNEDRNEWNRYHSHQAKTNITKLFMDEDLVTHANLTWFKGLNSDTAHEVFKQARIDLNLMGKYMFNENQYLKVTVDNALGSNITKPSYSYSANIVGFDEAERKFYIELGTKL